MPHLAAHLNAAHGTELRAAVATITGLPARRVIAAEIGELDPHGVVLEWLDDRGAHRARLRFRRPIRTADQLGCALRTLLGHR